MKKLFTGLLTLLCVFGVQTIPMTAKENSNDNSTQNTTNNNDGEHYIFYTSVQKSFPSFLL